jgi:hypothetical protein
MADAEGVEDGPDDAYSNAGEADDEERKSVDYKDSNLKARHYIETCNMES